MLGCVGVKADAGEPFILGGVESFVEWVEQGFASGDAGAGVLAFTQQ